ncbi:TPA: glycosyltransferase, partial [Candidatus Poribacteria bacterium]|nr:glycosyltransferase [Candidatus Poribacteria bacterium]
MPKLSIITINLNNREGLERTIQSVINQTFTDFEYIIIDGGSTDGS